MPSESNGPNLLDKPLKGFIVVYTKIWKKGHRDLRAPKIMSCRESIACRSESADSNAALELAFIRQCWQIMTKATIGARTRHDGLYKRGKIRVQVILN